MYVIHKRKIKAIMLRKVSCIHRVCSNIVVFSDVDLEYLEIKFNLCQNLGQGIAFDNAPVAIPSTIYSSNPDSIASPFSEVSSFAASVSVMYAASVVDKAIMCSIIASQLPAHPCNINPYLVIDLLMTTIDLPMA
ncbi:hypothetical protein Tco_1322700 [Tanacetum coccineum]